MAYKDEKFLDIPVINCHVHAYDFSDFDTLLEIRRKYNTEIFNVLAITAYEDGLLSQNPLCALFKAEHPDDVFAFGTLDYYPLGTPKEKLDLAGQAKRLTGMGYDGIKMLEGKPSIYKVVGGPLDAPVYDEFYGYLEEAQIPILSHTADPIKCWDAELIPEYSRKAGYFYGDGTYPSKEDLYKQTENILKRFPKLKIIFAHFFYLSAELERAADFLDRWPGVNLDITPGMELLPNFAKRPKDWHDFFTKYSDRIMFGTDDAYSQIDGFYSALRSFLETDRKFRFEHTRGEWAFDCEGICLDKKVLEKIYRDNFRRIVGTKPKKLDLGLLAENAEILLDKAQRLQMDKKITGQLKSIIVRIEQCAAQEQQ